MIHIAPDMGAPSLAAELEHAKESERIGHWSEARARYEALLHEPQLNDPNFAGRAMVLRWIGRTYLEEGRTGEALVTCKQARAAATRGDDFAGIAHATYCLAIAEQQLGNLDHSEDLYVEARGIATELGDNALVAMIDQNLGTIASSRGNLGHALRCYEASLKRYHALGRESGEYAVAEEYFKRAAQIAEEMKDTLLEAESAREQAEGAA